jgi:serine phosphatase RsbU (regulator of sigma subunit)
MTGTAISVFAPAPSIIRTWHVVRSAYAHGGRCGDVAFALLLSSGCTAIVVIDVAGHGAARAPLSSAIADAITAALLSDASPGAALGCADERLRTFDDESPYAVAFVALVHPALRTVVYASAGHDVAFALADDGRVRQLAPTVPMLGIPVAVRVRDGAFALGATETLVIVTDGVADSRPAGSNHFFGAERTARAVARSLRAGGDPARAVLDAACAHAHGRQADDIAIAVTRVERLWTTWPVPLSRTASRFIQLRDVRPHDLQCAHGPKCGGVVQRRVARDRIKCR